MRLLVRAGSLVVAAVAVAAVAGAWAGGRPELDASEATDVAVRALASVGVDAELAGAEPTTMVHETQDGAEVDAWSVVLVVDAVDDPTADDDAVGEEVEVRVRTSSGQLVYLDDRIGPDDLDRLLDDDQFAALGDHRDDEVADDWVRRNGIGTASGAIVVGTALALRRRAATDQETRP